GGPGGGAAGAVLHPASRPSPPARAPRREISALAVLFGELIKLGLFPRRLVRVRVSGVPRPRRSPSHLRVGLPRLRQQVLDPLRILGNRVGDEGEGRSVSDPGALPDLRAQDTPRRFERGGGTGEVRDGV